MARKLPIILGLSVMMSIPLAACSQGKSNSVDLSGIPVTEIVATHAFETNEKIADLSFVANDVAPWLGRLIATDLSGKMVTTDIEGRKPDKTGINAYHSTYGLNRSQASGVFLALNTDKKLEAFIESNDEGQFSAMRTSGPDIEAQLFCKSENATAETAAILSGNGTLQKLKYTVSAAEDGQISGAEYVISDEFATDKPASQCVVTDKYLLLIESGEKYSTVHINENESWNALRFPHIISSVAPLTISEKSALVLISNGEIFLFDPETASVTHQIKINSGLSIQGLESADMVAATQSNFGSTFNNGVVAFGQSDQNRIVFISLDYLANSLN